MYLHSQESSNSQVILHNGAAEVLAGSRDPVRGLFDLTSIRKVGFDMRILLAPSNPPQTIILFRALSVLRLATFHLR